MNILSGLIAIGGIGGWIKSQVHLAIHGSSDWFGSMMARRHDTWINKEERNEVLEEEKVECLQEDELFIYARCLRLAASSHDAAYYQKTSYDSGRGCHCCK